MPFYTGDYRRDTQHLSMMEHGAYVLMLAHCWDQRGPLPLDERRIFGICNARSNEEMGAVRHVLAEFFTRSFDGHYNSRIQREIEKANALSEKRAACGQLGGKSSKKRTGKSGRKGLADESNLLKNNSNSAFVQHEQAIAKLKPQTPTTTTTLTTTPKKHPQTPAFDAFWLAYPHYPQRSSKAKSWARWGSMKLEPIAQEVMRSLAACLAVPAWVKDGHAFVCASEVWLNKRLWEQEEMALTDSLIESIANDPRCK